MNAHPDPSLTGLRACQRIPAVVCISGSTAFSVTAEENMRTEQQSNSLNLLKFGLTSVPARLKSGGLPSVRAAPARVDRAAGHPLSTPARCWPELPAFYARVLLQIGRATRAPRPAAWLPKIAIARAASGFRGLPYLEAHMTCTDGVFDEREDGVINGWPLSCRVLADGRIAAGFINDTYF
ncbi:hypothetical protein Bbelb_294660 [Branchiostoma belcheri]|nr:hypothetical protein Bbelb_294660 [Branchiostoma belcheri]